MKLRILVLLYLIIFACACGTDLKAQDFGSAMKNRMGQMGKGGGRNSAKQEGDSLKEDPCIPLKDDRRCWTLDPMTSLSYEAVPDTSFLGLGNKQSMESKALAVVYTNTLFSPHQVQAYFDRRERHDYLFANAYNLFRVDPSQQLYYNTKLPCTVLSYSKAGGGLQTNDHLKINFFGNFNKQIGLGTRLDYVYARGEYMNSSTKPVNWNSYLYYEGDQYKAYFSFTLAKWGNQENGGIADSTYVLTPDNHKKNFTDPKNMPTNLANTWNDNDQRQIHFQHHYDLGTWEEQDDPTDTSAVKDVFIPVASIYHSIDFEHLAHHFQMDEGGEQSTEGFFRNHYYNDKTTLDSTRYWNLSTYAGLRLNEGFNRFSQFSLSAFIGAEIQQYELMRDTLDLGFIERHHHSTTVWAGGQISRHLTSALNFDATFRSAIGGDKKGDFDINGKARIVFPFGQRSKDEGQMYEDGTIGDNSSLLNPNSSLNIDLKGFIGSTSPSYLMQHYFSNHFKWSNKFEREYRVRAEGALSYPRTLSKARLCYEHISRYHYWGSDGLPHQFDKEMDVFGLELRQGLRAGKWLQWDNAVLCQWASHDEILPLPAVSVESDLSFHFRIARTLTIQAGVAAYYYTAYYAPLYQPGTQQFCNQHYTKCGNYPLLNGYVNCNLKRIKFFLTAHNMIQNAVTNNMFHMPLYPVETRRIEYGIILDLQN